jgi:hypothetical protein
MGDENTTDLRPRDDDDWPDPGIDGLKEAINNFLWMRLPGRLSLSRAERIACEVYEIIVHRSGEEAPDE